MTSPLSRVASRLRHESPVLLTWALLLLATATPYLVATLLPPEGTKFTGFFFYRDDQYNYLAYSQQAETGSFLFHNKLILESHAPGFVNLEWWAIGLLSAALGGFPLLANRLVTVPLILAFLLAVDRWLARLGLPEDRRFFALIAVGFSGGLGWAFHLVLGVGLFDSPDLSVGMYPFQLSLSNSHFLVGIVLLLWSFLLLDDPKPSHQVCGVLLAAILALSRPYDVVTLGIVRGGTVVLSRPPRDWLKALAPLAALLPLVALDAWMLFLGPSRLFATVPYAYPSAIQFFVALLPPALFLLPNVSAGRICGTPGSIRLTTFLWMAFVASLVFLQPGGFWAQFLIGAATPLLMLVSVTLARLRPRALLVATACLSGNACFLLWLVLQPNPAFFAPAEQVAAAQAFRAVCHRGELALSPVGVGLWSSAYSACTPFVSHPMAPGHVARLDAVSSFYGPSSPEARAKLLEALCVQHVLLPGIEGPRPLRWLGATTPYELAATAGQGSRALGIYSRNRGATCTASLGAGLPAPNEPPAESAPPQNPG